MKITQKTMKFCKKYIKMMKILKKYEIFVKISVFLLKISPIRQLFVDPRR
jgi:hypothetical protein